MRDPRLGLALVALGVLLVIAGLVLRSRADDTAQVAATSAPASATTTTTPATAGVPSTTLAPTPSVTTTTTSVAPTPTTVVATTIPPTTTAAPEPLIEAFVSAYAVATESGDIDFLYHSMHPAVIEAGGEELCRQFVADEIVQISKYHLTGPVTGPTTVAPGVTGYRAEVTFVFQGETFTDNAAFAIVDGEVRWFTTCR